MYLGEYDVLTCSSCALREGKYSASGQSYASGQSMYLGEYDVLTCSSCALREGKYSVASGQSLCT